MLKTICYISNSTESDSIENIKKMYSKAKTNNAQNNISGILIYHKGNYLQVLEGTHKDVDETYNRISKDHRHKNLIKVINTDTEYRIFEEYNFGFTIVRDSSEFKELKAYLNWLKNANHKITNELITMVENFIKTIG
ncbi:MAG: BLUF domain-containing protein [Jejuia sp.]